MVESSAAKASIEAEQSGFPEGWVRTTVSEICNSIQYGYTAAAIESSEGPRFLRITDIQDNKVAWNEVPSCEISKSDTEKFALRDGDIVFARTGATTGKSFLIKSCPLAVFASYLIRMRPHSHISSDFISFFFQTPEYWRLISDNVSGIAQPSCNASKLGKLELSLPPLAEQKRIVAKVEALLERVNKARERLDHVPEILKKFRQSVLAAACSGRLTADWREENPADSSLDILLNETEEERKYKWSERLGNRRYRPPITSLPEDLFDIPDTWRWVTFDTCCLDITVGHVGSMRDNYVSKGVPFLRSQNVRPLRYDSSGLVYIPESFDEQLSKSRLYGGEILVTRSGANTGDCCVYPADAPQANCSDVVISRPLSILDAQYGAIFICSPEGEAYLRRGETGIAQPHFNTNAMRNTPLALPPPAEQTEIVRRTDNLVSIAERVEMQLVRAIERTNQIQQSLLAKAFAGELVETEADLARREGRDYEPASVLLERIAAERSAELNGKPKRRARARARR